MTLPRFLRGGWRTAIVLYVVFAGAYLGAAGGRLTGHSPYNHYVYLAEGWLHGRLALAGPPPNENDWAKVDVLKLKDGRELRGLYGSRTGGGGDEPFRHRVRPVVLAGLEVIDGAGLEAAEPERGTLFLFAGLNQELHRRARADEVEPIGPEAPRPSQQRQHLEGSVLHLFHEAHQRALLGFLDG